jgi:hypothetical protein
MKRLAVFFLVTLVGVVPSRAAPTAPRSTEPGETVRGHLYLDVPLWDLANEGLPFRLTLALPSPRDPIAQLLRAEETRWSFSAGYAKVYNSWDATTGVFKNSGGHAALFSAGRQFWWSLPDSIDRHWLPRLMIEFGVNYATRPFPADGTRASLKLITGVEWQLPRSRWSAGVMWPHFSNANLLDKNAGYDGLTFRLGRAMAW